jgi:hypothetical protein
MALFRNAHGVGAVFPGPITLRSSRLKWGGLAVAGGFLTIGLVSVSAHGHKMAMLGAVLFAAGTALCVTTLLPGAAALKLDGHGFDVTRLYQTRRYRWSAVSDFAVWSFIGRGIVVFKVPNEHPDYFERRNAGLTGGRNGYLPDTYGLSAGSLARIMTEWQGAALKRSDQVSVRD